MCKHEDKYCPSCHQKFECKVGSIHLCQCSAITLSEQEKHFIQSRYDDCLCINCLKNMKQFILGESPFGGESPSINI